MECNALQCSFRIKAILNQVLCAFILMSYIPLVSAGDTYAAFIDAGSTATKLYIFKWPWPSITTDLPHIQNSFSKKFEPVSDYLPNLVGLDDFLKNIVETAKEQVPDEEQHVTSIYFIGTAGMRILNPMVCKRIIKSVQSVLQNAQWNTFKYSAQNIRVLSGEEEGTYSWISVNYLRGFFQSRMPSVESVGVLELGGGSIQMTFVPTVPIYAGMFPITLSDMEYYLYTHSYLYLGQTYLEVRVNHFIIARTPSRGNLRNPCMLKGDSIHVELKGKNYTIRGKGSMAECLAILNSFVQKTDSRYCHPKPCSVGNIYQPTINNKTFIAIKAFVYTPEALGAVDDSGHLDIRKLNDTAVSYCSKSLSEAVNKENMKKKFASSHCMMGLFIPALLTSAYGFPDDTKNIIAVRKINGSSIVWPIGLLLNDLKFTVVPLPCVGASSTGDILKQVVFFPVLFTMCVYIVFLS